MPTLVHSVPTPDEHITELHCWVATFDDGTEGIVAAVVPPLGMSPLLSSRRSTAEQLEALAHNVMRLSQGTDHPVLSVRLVTFTSTEGVRQ